LGCDRDYLSRPPSRTRRESWLSGSPYWLELRTSLHELQYGKVRDDGVECFGFDAKKDALRVYLAFDWSELDNNMTRLIKYGSCPTTSNFDQQVSAS
jgi:hypothetical protein